MNRLGWKFWLGAGWVLFNLSLAGWWLTFGLRQAEILGSIQHERALELASQSRMLLSEGVILMLSILLGGLFLLYYIVQEKRQADLIRGFFASFSHELKTSIASFRLQVEGFIADAPVGASRKQLERLSRDSVKLELQLENSLVFSQMESSGFFYEQIPLEKILLSLSQQWPELAFRATQSNVLLNGDRRALEIAFKNIAQNALLHGQASELAFETKSESGFLRISVKNNGAPFEGDEAKLGKLFHRHNSRSGSGVGLYLVRTLIEKQSGRVEFHLDPEKRLVFDLFLPEGVLS
jgi:signal transduction histidine kinase